MFEDDIRFSKLQNDLQSRQQPKQSTVNTANVNQGDTNDDTVLTYGRYEGVKLKDVPSGYFRHIWTGGGISKDANNPLHNYIKANKQRFKIQD